MSSLTKPLWLLCFFFLLFVNTFGRRKKQKQRRTQNKQVHSWQVNYCSYYFCYYYFSCWFLLREALTLPSATMYFVFFLSKRLSPSQLALRQTSLTSRRWKKTQLTKQSGVKSGKFPERRDRRCRRPISAGRRLCPAWMEPKNLSGLAAAYSFPSCVGPPFDAMMMNDGPRVTLRHAFTMALIRLAMRETTAADTHSRTRHTHTHTQREMLRNASKISATTTRSENLFIYWARRNPAFIRWRGSGLF